MAGVKDGIWKPGNNWYISVKVKSRRRVKSFGRDRKAAELVLGEILKHRAVMNVTKRSSKHRWLCVHDKDRSAYR